MVAANGAEMTCDKDTEIHRLRQIRENLNNTLTNLNAPIDEIDALACLLGMARIVDSNERFGYELEFLDEIVIRRIRALARRCQNDMSRWLLPCEGDNFPVKIEESSDHTAPRC